MARKNEWPLDRMVLQCDVTKKTREDMAGAPREGAYVHGLYMEGTGRLGVVGAWYTDQRIVVRVVLELRSGVKVEVVVMGSPSLIVLNVVSVDGKYPLKKKFG